jgi:hypothetical protein
MKRIDMPGRALAACAITLLLAASAAAQTADPASAGQPAPAPQGPLVVERIRSGAFFAPDVKITDIDGRTGTLVGGYGGWLTDETFFVGAGGSWLANDPNDIDMYYLGLVAGWRVPLGQAVRFGVRGLVGGGEARLWDTYSLDWNPGRPTPKYRPGDQPSLPNRPGTIRYRYADGFVVFEPQADVTMRLANWMAITLGGGYRFIGGAYAGDRLSGATGSVALQFGGGR